MDGKTASYQTWRWLVPMVALAAGGCGVVEAKPGPVLPAVPLPAAYIDSEISGSADPNVLDRWWLMFNDPTLSALEDEAFRGAPDSRTFAARLLEAQATRAAQTASTLPSGSITGGASREKTYAIGVPGNDLNPTSGLTDTASGNLNVSWELDLFGRLATARRVANADAAQARFDIEGGRAALVAEVADDYFQVRGLTIQLEDATQTVRIESDLLNIASRKAAAGAGPEDEVERVQGQLAQAKAQLADIQANLDTVRRQLLILVGRPLDQTNDLRFAGDIAAAPPATPSALPSELLTRRPDIREAEFRLRSQLGAAHLAHLAIFPTITLLPGLGLSSTATPGVSYLPPSTLVTTQQVSTTGFWNLAANISAPTLDIPKLLDRAHAEDARSRESAIAYEKVVRTAFGEAQNALVELSAGEQATTLLTDGALRARHAYEGSRRRYEAGLDTLSATLTAEQEWRSLRSALTSERVDTLRRAVRVYKALGGGWRLGPSQAGA